MNVSSDKKRVLEKVTLKQVQALLSILRDSTLRRTPFIEQTYKERSYNFRETTHFLIDIGWVSANQDELGLTEVSDQLAHEFSNPARVARNILDTLTTTSNDYTALLSQYLVGFTLAGNEPESRPSTTKRIEDSALRNFLMDLGAVVYDNQHDRFVLDPDHVYLYVWAKNVTGPTSRTALEAESRRRQQFGTSAEEAVFGYEKVRVGEQIASKVQHISKTLPFASYDIKSFTVDTDATVDRFIEVKAVSRDSYEFFWTRIELEAARLLGDKYYLYLLPAGAEEFDFSGLLILKNAYSAVFENSNDWTIEENVVLCRRK